MKPPLTLDSASASALAWPASLTALRQLFQGRGAAPAAPATFSPLSAKSEPAEPPVWTSGARRAIPPEPVVVPSTTPFAPPAPPRGNFRIHCLPLGPSAELSLRVKAECEQHDTLGYTLVSSFSHDGHAFLIFKRK